MITTLRTKFHRYFFRVIVWLTIATFIFMFSYRRGGSGSKKDTIASVNGYALDATTFERKVKEQEEFLVRLRQRFGGFTSYLLSTMGLRDDARFNALETLIQERLLTQAAAQASIAIADQYAQDIIMSTSSAMEQVGELIPPYLYDKNGRLDGRQLAEFVRRQGLFMNDFETLVEESLQRTVLNQVLAGAVVVPSMAITEEALRATLTRQYSIFELPLHTYIAKARVLTFPSQELERYYQEHKHDYELPALYTVRVWDFEQTSETNKKEFAAQKEHLVTVPESEFKAFMQRVHGQESLKTDIAVSTTPFGKAVATLSTQNKRAYYIDAKQAHIVEFISLKPGSVAPFDSVQDKVKDGLVQQKAQDALATTLKQMLSDYIDKGTALKADGMTTVTTPMMSANDTAWDNLKQKKFPVERMKRMVHKGAAFMALESDRGFIVVLTDSKENNKELPDTEKKSLQERLEHEFLQTITNGFIASLRKTGTIDVYIRLADIGGGTGEFPLSE